MTGSELRSERKALGLTQRQIAKALGVSLTAVAYWERGERPMPPWMPLAIEGLKGRASA